MSQLGLKQHMHWYSILWNQACRQQAKDGTHLRNIVVSVLCHPQNQSFGHHKLWMFLLNDFGNQKAAVVHHRTLFLSRPRVFPWFLCFKVCTGIQSWELLRVPGNTKQVNAITISWGIRKVVAQMGATFRDNFTSLFNFNVCFDHFLISEGRPTMLFAFGFESF